MKKGSKFTSGCSILVAVVSTCASVYIFAAQDGMVSTACTVEKPDRVNNENSSGIENRFSFKKLFCTTKAVVGGILVSAVALIGCAYNMHLLGNNDDKKAPGPIPPDKFKGLAIRPRLDWSDFIKQAYGSTLLQDKGSNILVHSHQIFFKKLPICCQLDYSDFIEAGVSKSIDFCVLNKFWEFSIPSQLDYADFIGRNWGGVISLTVKNNYKHKDSGTDWPSEEKRLSISTVGSDDLIKGAYDRLLVKNNYGHKSAYHVLPEIGKEDLSPYLGNNYSASDVAGFIWQLRVARTMQKDIEKEPYYKSIKALVMDYFRKTKRGDASELRYWPNEKFLNEHFYLDKDDCVYTTDSGDTKNRVDALVKLVYYFSNEYLIRQEKVPGEYAAVARNIIEKTRREKPEYFNTDKSFFDYRTYTLPAAMLVVYFKEPEYDVDGKYNPEFDDSDFSFLLTDEYRYKSITYKVPLEIYHKIFEQLRKEAIEKDKEKGFSPFCPLESTSCHPFEDELLESATMRGGNSRYIENFVDLRGAIDHFMDRVGFSATNIYGHIGSSVCEKPKSYEDYYFIAKEGYFNRVKEVINYFGRYLKKKGK